MNCGDGISVEAALCMWRTAGASVQFLAAVHGYEWQLDDWLSNLQGGQTDGGPLSVELWIDV